MIDTWLKYYQWADLWRSHRQDWDSHIQPVRQHNVRVQRWNKNTHTATGFVHVTVRKFSLRQRKIDSEKEKRSDANDVNNCVAFMFDEIRYELNDVEIDRNWNITSMLKNYVLKTYDS